MVHVKPFYGILYNKKIIKNLTSVFCPTYDEIYDHNRINYLKDSPYNIVQILSGEEFPEDNETNNKNTRARKYFKKWMKEGILTKDPEPCIYIYETTYTVRKGEPKTKRGFLSLTLLEEYNKGYMKPHERIFDHKKKAIFNLIKDTKVNISPIYCVYPRSDMIHEIIKNKITQKPILEFLDRKGYIEKLWRVDELNYIKIIENEMKIRSAYIADGHHRYEALHDYKIYCEKQNPKAKHGQPYEYILTLYVEDSSKGLSILPTHRLLKEAPDYSIEKLSSKLKKYFNVEILGNMDGKLVFMKMRSNFLKHAFGLYYKDHFIYITLKPEIDLKKYGNKDNSKVWNGLDVNILNNILLEKVLNIKSKDIESGKNISYTRWIEKACKSVEENKDKMAIFLNGTKMKQIMQVADNEEKMPQKSTHFYPKPLTGIVMYDLHN